MNTRILKWFQETAILKWEGHSKYNRKEKDITMNANMKVSEQCRIAASKGNQVLGMIRRNISYKDKSLHGPLCTACSVLCYNYRAYDFIHNSMYLQTYVSILLVFKTWPPCQRQVHCLNRSILTTTVSLFVVFSVPLSTCMSTTFCINMSLHLVPFNLE